MDRQEEIVKSRLEENLSLNKLARKFKISSYTVREVLVEAGLIPKERNHLLTGRKIKYSVDNNFFSIIDTEEKAYILGFVYADGSVNERYKQMVIGLKYDDKEILEKISKSMSSTFPITINYGSYSKNYPKTKKCAINITSHQIFYDLCNIGCVPRKSDILIFPENIPDELIHHFMRGYFDGDGTVYDVKSEKNGIKMGLISTKEFCDSFLDKLPYDGKAKTRKEYRSKKNVWYFTIGGYNMVKKIYEFLYKDATIFLDRKKKVFDNFYKH